MSAADNLTGPARGHAVSGKSGNNDSPAPAGGGSRAGGHGGDAATPAAMQTAARHSPTGTEPAIRETIAILGGTGNLGTAARHSPTGTEPARRETIAILGGTGDLGTAARHSPTGTEPARRETIAVLGGTGDLGTAARRSPTGTEPAIRETIAILGGTGDLGTGLAGRWSRAGYPVVIGSRTPARAEAALADLRRRHPDTTARAATNAAAAEAADIVVLTVPAAHQVGTLAGVRASLTGKIVIDVTVPLVPPKVGTVQLPAEGSAGKRAQEFLGDGVMVVSAFQNVAAHLLQQEVDIECDVLVAGNKKAARDKVIELVRAAGMTGWHAGPIDNAAAAEALTSVLIQINRRHPISHAGIKLVGQG